MLKMSSISALAVILSVAGAAHPDESPKFELLHMWVHEVETNALAAITDPMESQGVYWSESVVASDFLAVRTKFAERLSLGIPPTGVSWIAGGNSARELLESGVFRRIEPAVGGWNVADALIPEIYEAVKYEDGLSVLPLGIHLQNHAVYNGDILEELGESPPRSWSEFLEIAPRAQELGYVPLVMSDQRWQLRFLLNAILVEKLDAEEFMELLHMQGDLERWRAPLREIIEIFGKLRQFANSDNYELDWWDAVEQVASGQALLHILGDFTSPLYQSDANVICTLPPGNTYYIWAFDSIALTNTNDANQKAGQDLLIKTISRSDNQINYITQKGGIPAYRNVDIKRLNPCSRESVKNWRSASSRVLLTSNEWSGAGGVIIAVSQEYWRNYPEMSVDEAVDSMMSTLMSAKATAAE